MTNEQLSKGNEIRDKLILVKRSEEMVKRYNNFPHTAADPWIQLYSVARDGFEIVKISMETMKTIVQLIEMDNMVQRRKLEKELESI